MISFTKIEEFCFVNCSKSKKMYTGQLEQNLRIIYMYTAPKGVVWTVSILYACHSITSLTSVDSKMDL